MRTFQGVRTGDEDLPIESYALIGDGRTAALVAADGSIDWLCCGRFDGPAVFCRLLDAACGGYLQLAPDIPFESTRRYLVDTNVLETHFESATGTVRVTDCMPLGQDEGPLLLRKVEGLTGDVDMRLEFVPTFNFAREPAVLQRATGGWLARAATFQLRLWCPATTALDGGKVIGTFRVRTGQTRWVCLTHGGLQLEEQSAEKALVFTIEAWKRWSSRGRYPGPYADLLRRSALALKLLIHTPTGAMVAAPTTSLPETIGGERNWDYRFSWLRDASWLVSALMDLGYHDESMAFIDWLKSLNLADGSPAAFYDLDGHALTKEEELTHLRGYRNSRPVRVGNAAAGQAQHDVFGEIVAAIHMCSEAMPSMRPLEPELWHLVAGLADRAAEQWAEPDHGIWEVRDRSRHFVTSKVFCWTALDRALQMAQRDGLEGPIAKWNTERQRIRQAVLESGFDRRANSFVRAFGESELDAALLLLPRYGFLAADDPRFTATVSLIRRKLTSSGFVRRYSGEDGLAGTEGAFVACSFWLADAIARQGRLDEARRIFEATASCANDVGLFSEEVSLEGREFLGNFPQAFTHLALVRAAMTISEVDEADRE
jgi:alpha,alpha-trehalase